MPERGRLARRTPAAHGLPVEAGHGQAAEARWVCVQREQSTHARLILFLYRMAE